METLLSQSLSTKDSRGSQRVALNIPVVIEGMDVLGRPFSESTHRLVVNNHGALVQLDACVGLGHLLTIRHSKTGEELFCRTARLGSEASGKHEAGIEFLHSAPQFWRVAFPPPDWQPAADPAERYANAARASSL